jgi:hypothetical protein
MVDKIDSNVTGLRYSEEIALKILPTNPVWYGLEPNSYSDFGGQISTIARNPINASRQRKKGVTTDLDASGGFNQDLTFDNTTHLLQGFFFADARETNTTAPMNGTKLTVTAVNSANHTFTLNNHDKPFIAGALVLCKGFGASLNNGLKRVTTGSGSTNVITVAETLVDEPSPPSDASITVVGQQFDLSDASIALNGDLVRLQHANIFNLTTLGLIPGQWIFVGGDDDNNKFTYNNGFARISKITPNYFEFDKVSWKAIAETSTSKSIYIFFGTIIKNEADPALIKRRTYQVERTLGNDANGPMGEYLVGAVPNELTLNISQADKVNIDLTFVAVDNEQRTGLMGLKQGTRPLLKPSDAFNTSNDFSRIKLALVSENAAPNPLFAFATEMTLTINNNVTPDKAIGVLGAFDTSVGTFEVGGSITAYFANIEGVQAIRKNEDVTVDIIMASGNSGLLFDIPLLSLGDGRLAVEQDQAITLPLETNAAESKFNHTLLFESFPYLPNLAID